MRVILAEDSILLREGLARLLQEAGFDVVAQVGSADELLAATEEHRPSVVVTDIKMPPTHTDEGVRAAETIHDRYPGTGVLVLSQFVEPRYAVTLMNAGGGIGYLLKDRVGDIDDLVNAVTRVAKGGSIVDPKVVSELMSRGRENDSVRLLSPRELEVLSLMAEGWSNRSIADKLYLSPKTLESHIASIFSKLGLPPAGEEHRRVAAVLTYLRS